MGVNTHAIIKRGTSVPEIAEALSEKYTEVEVFGSSMSDFFTICFNSGEKDRRRLAISYSDSCKSDYGIDGVWLSLGCWGKSVEIMKFLCDKFGGYIDDNDCDEDGYYAINFEKFSNSENKEIDLLTHEIISKLGYKNLQATLVLFDKYKKLGR